MKKLQVAMLSLFLCAFSATVCSEDAIEEVDFFSQEIVSFEGVVKSVEKIAHPGGKMFGMHLVVESLGESYEVHLGPSWYMDEIGLNIADGSNITVEGFPDEYDDQKVIIAKSLQVGSKTYVLRDDMGVPAWSRRGGGY